MSTERFSGFASPDEAEESLGDKSPNSDEVEIDTSDFTRRDYKCHEIYLLHRDGGYQFTPDGLISSLTKQERQTFFRGYEVENEIEQRQQQAGGEGKGASQGDNAAFDEYVEQMNNNQQSSPRRNEGFDQRGGR